MRREAVARECSHRLIEFLLIALPAAQVEDEGQGIEQAWRQGYLPVVDLFSQLPIHNFHIL